MTDFSNRRGARQLWITRGHLAALGTATLFIAMLAFFLGVQVGRGSVPQAPAAATGHLLPDPEDEDALEALLREVELARLEAARDEDAAPSQQGLSFPTTLRGGTEEPATLADPEEGVTTSVPPRAEDQPVPPEGGADVPIESGWAVQVASYQSAQEAEARVAELASLDLRAYQIAALVDGQTWYRVRVGGFRSKSAAADARDALATRLGTQDLMVAEAP